MRSKAYDGEVYYQSAVRKCD